MAQRQQDNEAIAAQPDFEITSVFCYSAGLAERPGNLAKTAPVSNCYLLQYAIDRLRDAGREFAMHKALEDLDRPDRLATLAAEVENHLKSEHGADLVADKTKKFIVRLAYKLDGRLDFKSAAIGPFRESALYFPDELIEIPSDDQSAKASPIYVDTESTTPSPFMKHKTSYRGEYDAARARHGGQEAPPAECEVLLFNDEGQVTGGAFSTVYFYRDGHYVTPSSGSGCKVGVSRRWALTKGAAKEEVIAVKGLEEGERVWTSTAVAGFTKAHITLKPRVQSTESTA